MKKSFCLAAKAVALALSSLAVLPAVQAQDASNYPTRPIRLVVSQQAGGSSDTVARLWTEHAGKAINATITVENKPGAGGIIAAQQVLGQPADGYTLMFGGVSQMVLNKFVYKPLPYDPEKDFVGVGCSAPCPSSWWPTRPRASSRSTTWSSTPRPTRASSTSRPRAWAIRPNWRWS